MFVLPSRGRPHNLRRLLDAWEETRATLPVWLRLDDDDPNLPEYLTISLPSLWHLEVGPRVSLSIIYNKVYELVPETTGWWGLIADDVVPETVNWDFKLVEAAGAGGMAVPAGGHDDEGAPHFVLGGDLVRDIGWLALPGLDRIYIDTVWMLIAKHKGVFRRMPNVMLRHHHFSNGKALFDDTYRKHHKPEDRRVYETFVQGVGP